MTSSSVTRSHRIPHQVFNPSGTKKQKVAHEREPFDAVRLSAGRQVFKTHLYLQPLTFLTRKELCVLGRVCRLFRMRQLETLERYPGSVAVSEFVKESPLFSVWGNREKDEASLRYRCVSRLNLDDMEIDPTHFSLPDILSTFCRATHNHLREIDFGSLDRFAKIKRKSQREIRVLLDSPSVESVVFSVKKLAKSHMEVLCKMSHRTLRHLKMCNLQQLPLFNVNFGLNNLEIENYNADADSLQRLLRSCPQLTALSLRIVRGMTYISICLTLCQATHPRLQRLDLNDDRWRIAQEPQRSLMHADEVGAIMLLGRQCPQLTELNLRDWQAMNDDCLVSLKGQWPRDLQKLTLSGSFTSFQPIALLPSPSLAELTLVSCHELAGDKAAYVKALEQAKTKITTLICYDCPKVSFPEGETVLS